MTRTEVRSLPVFIVSRDRLEYLRAQIKWLEEAGMRNIQILDNDSRYPPLLEFYRQTSYCVHYFRRNLGCFGLWRSPLGSALKDTYYVYTDPDIVGIGECPLDFMDFFYETLQAHPEVEKVGFGLKIDDLPACYAQRQEVVVAEQKYWKKKIEGKLYRAPIDTTFALYRPNSFGGYWLKALRTGYPYVARHLPWYQDSALPSAEFSYYLGRITESTEWTIREKR